MSLRQFLLSAIFVVAAGSFMFSSSPPAYSQGAGPSDESFESADGVKLSAKFYRAINSKTNSCVMLLPQYKKDPTKGDWDGLAKRLSGEGFNVLLLNYRGHGKSTDINGKEFFGHPILGPFNQKFVHGANKNPPKSTLSMSELKPQYLAMLVNDIMAARSFLERKNDAGEVNISTLYLIGAGDAAPLGMFYTAVEWHREAERPNNDFIRRQYIAGNQWIASGATAGKDIAACIWLTPEKHSASLTDGVIKSFILNYAPDMRDETRMLFLYGEKDDAGKAKAKYFYDEVLVAKGKSGKVGKMELTEMRPVKGAKSLAGVDLLGKNDTFGTEDTISKYLKAIEDDRKSKARYARQYTAPLPVALQTFGVNP